MEQDQENNQVAERIPEGSSGFSREFLQWVQQSTLPPLTNTQHRFAEWLLQEEQAKVISQLGDLETIFQSIRRYIKNRN